MTGQTKQLVPVAANYCHNVTWVTGTGKKKRVEKAKKTLKKKGKNALCRINK
jgi:hypothetical protein